MRKRYSSSWLKLYTGDIRDPASVMNAMRGVDYMFHAAALKQAMDLLKTKVLGTENGNTRSIFDVFDNA